MKILPYETFDIKTSLKPDEVTDVMRQNVEPKTWKGFGYSHSHFKGKVWSYGFEITRIIHRRNSFLPIIRGRFGQHDRGTKIIISMRPPIFSVVFLCLWIACAGMFTFLIACFSVPFCDPGRWSFIYMFNVFLDASIRAVSASPPDRVFLIPFGLSLLALIVSRSAFWSEANKARRILSEILKEIKQANKVSQPTS